MNCQWCGGYIKHKKWSWFPFCGPRCIAEEANDGCLDCIPFCTEGCPNR